MDGQAGRLAPLAENVGPGEERGAGAGRTAPEGPTALGASARWRTGWSTPVEVRGDGEVRSNALGPSTASTDFLSGRVLDRHRGLHRSAEEAIERKIDSSVKRGTFQSLQSALQVCGRVTIDRLDVRTNLAPVRYVRGEGLVDQHCADRGVGRPADGRGWRGGGLAARVLEKDGGGPARVIRTRTFWGSRR